MADGQTAQPVIDAATHETRAQRKVRVEGELSQLWLKSRLACHMFERYQGFAMPDHSQEGFSELTGQPVAQALQRYPDVPLISMSLIPPCPAPFEPIWIGNYLFRQQGYLVDVSQERENPAAVVRVLERDLDTGFNFKQKKLQFGGAGYDYATLVRGLYELYEHENAESFIAKVAENPRELTHQQLDLLTQFYEEEGARGVADYNEIVAAASNDHITAIAGFVRLDNRDPEYNVESNRFIAAYNAYLHLEHGIDKPAVLYHLDKPRDQAVEYIGQGREELKEAIIGALVKLQHHKNRMGGDFIGWEKLIGRTAKELKMFPWQIEEAIDQHGRKANNATQATQSL